MKIFHKILLVLLISNVVVYFVFYSELFKETQRNEKPNEPFHKVVNLELSHSRLDHFLNLLQLKESLYLRIDDRLGLFSFKQLLKNESFEFFNETHEFLSVENGKVVTTDKFLSYLSNKSQFYSFEKTHSNYSNGKLEIVTPFFFH